MTNISLDHYPIKKTENIRYSDTDRQGHVNNAIFVTFVESARVDILYPPEHHLLTPGCEFVIANLNISFLNEMHWPGDVVTGTRVSKIGRSSVTFEHGLFQNQFCTATATTAIVMINSTTRKSTPFSERAIAQFQKMMV